MAETQERPKPNVFTAIFAAIQRFQLYYLRKPAKITLGIVEWAQMLDWPMGLTVMPISEQDIEEERLMGIPLAKSTKPSEISME